MEPGRLEAMAACDLKKRVRVGWSPRPSHSAVDRIWVHTAGGTAQIGQGAMLESSVVVGKWGAERGGRGERMSLTGLVSKV